MMEARKLATEKFVPQSGQFLTLDSWENKGYSIGVLSTFSQLLKCGDQVC